MKSKLIIHRVDQLLFSARTFKVYCNNKLIGKIPNYGCYEFDLEEGFHCVKIKCWPNTSEEYNFQVDNDDDTIELYTGAAFRNIFESTGYNSLKLLPKKEFFKIYKQEAETQFKDRVQHHHWVAIPGLLISILLSILTFIKPELFSGEAGISFVLALAIGIGAALLIKRNWILSKSFCINKPAYDAAIILFVFLAYVHSKPYQIAAILLAIPLIALWLFMRRKYAG